MSEMFPGPQLVQARTIAGGEAESEGRRANHCDTGDRGLPPDQEHDKEAPRSFLLILLRALGTMHT